MHICELVETANFCSANYNGQWVPARALTWENTSIRERTKAAIKVLKGTADVLYWHPEVGANTTIWLTYARANRRVVDGYKVFYSRPKLDAEPLLTRLSKAWDVFTGVADSLTWEEDRWGTD